MNNLYFNTFDIDGVIYLENGLEGVKPNVGDFIVTGRSLEERHETEKMLLGKGITNLVVYNKTPFDKKTRESSAVHKANIISYLHRRFQADNGLKHGIHFEDDPLQIEIIKTMIPWVRIVHVNSNGLVELENKRHDDD